MKHVAMDEKFLLNLLNRAHAGEDPDMLLAETYANSEQIEQ